MDAGARRGGRTRVERLPSTPQVASAFFANQCRREMVQLRGLAGTVAPGPAAGTVVVAAEGSRSKLESFARWCARGPQEIALEGGQPTVVGEAAFGAAQGLSGFACADDLCEVDVDATDAEDDDDEIKEGDLIAALIDELS